jgi:hypothetical protein
MWELVGGNRLEPFRTKCSPAGTPTLTLPKGRESGGTVWSQTGGDAKGSKGQHDSEEFTRSHPLGIVLLFLLWDGFTSSIEPR